jgi:hypothetical protein
MKSEYQCLLLVAVGLAMALQHLLVPTDAAGLVFFVAFAALSRTAASCQRGCHVRLAVGFPPAVHNR